MGNSGLISGVALAVLFVASGCAGGGPAPATEDAAPTPGTEDAAPTPGMEIAPGIRLATEGNLIFLTADNFGEGLVQRIASIDGVSQVDSREGSVSTIVVTVDPSHDVDKARQAIRRLVQIEAYRQIE